MPFVQQTSRIFTLQNIEAINEGQLGVYGLFKSGEWVYVGKGDIRNRLLSHLRGDNPCIIQKRPTHWVDEVIPNSFQRDQREKELIIELGPSCNERVG